MDFSFSEEQQLLKDSVDRFVQDEYKFESRRKIIASPEGFKRENWKQFADLGWLAVPFAEEDGGIGGGPVETMIILESFGRGLVTEPYMPTVVMGGGFIQHGGTKAQRDEFLPGIIDGSTLYAAAFAEPKGRYNLSDITTTAKKDGAGYVLDGYKAVVIGGPTAGKLVVTARTAGDQRDENGIGVFVVDADAEGVSRRDYPTIDALRASEVTLENVKVGPEAVIGDPEGGLPLVEKVIDRATAAICAEAVGAMEVLNATTVEYSKTRVQFGQPIGKFQVLQHRMVDMFMEYEQSKSIMYMATLHLDDADDVRKKAVSAAKAQIGKAGRFIGQQSVQLHGGMGMTDELNVGHYFKRLTMIETMFGNTDHHLKRFGAIDAEL